MILRVSRPGESPLTANAAVPPAVALTKRSGMCVSRSGESPMILRVSRPGESPLNFCVSRIGESPSFLQVFSLPLAVTHRVLFEVGSDLARGANRESDLPNLLPSDRQVCAQVPPTPAIGDRTPL